MDLPKKAEFWDFIIPRLNREVLLLTWELLWQVLILSKRNFPCNDVSQKPPLPFGLQGSCLAPWPLANPGMFQFASGFQWHKAGKNRNSWTLISWWQPHMTSWGLCGFTFGIPCFWSFFFILLDKHFLFSLLFKFLCFLYAPLSTFFPFATFPWSVSEGKAVAFLGEHHLWGEKNPKLKPEVFLGVNDDCRGSSPPGTSCVWTEDK